MNDEYKAECLWSIESSLTSISGSLSKISDSLSQLATLANPIVETRIVGGRQVEKPPIPNLLAYLSEIRESIDRIN